MKTLPALPEIKRPLRLAVSCSCTSKNSLHYGPEYSCIEVSEENYDIIHKNYPGHCLARWGVKSCFFFVSPEAFDSFRKAGYDFEALEATSFRTFNGKYLGAEAINEYYKNLKDEK